MTIKMVALFHALASTANTIANGPTFSHGPPFLLRSFSHTAVLVSPPQDDMLPFMNIKKELKNWIPAQLLQNNWKFISSSIKIKEPLNRKIYCPPHCRDGEPSLVLSPMSRPTTRSPSWENDLYEFIPSLSGLPYVFSLSIKKSDKLEIGLGKLLS